ncbi:hypothetical protein [Rathayibacter caricis]|uniref:hypothetical protein n=1 Tax=Rathayibacter caricis TaxID=110936 RepID=UPI0011B2108A|nr:hypothetical protein [Rathayibacter caricis]
MSSQIPKQVRARGAYRAKSAVFMPPGQQLQVNIDTGDQIVSVRMGNYNAHGTIGKVPNGIWIFGEGSGADIYDAEHRFRNAVEDSVAVVSFLTNAATEEPTLEILYEVTPESEEHDALFLSQTDRYSVPPSVVRESPKFVRAGMKALAEHEYSETLWQGISRYMTALRHWGKGEGLMSFAFLYMAMEALTPIARVPLLEQFGGADGLAEHWGIDKRQVDAEIRKRILFDGDLGLYKSARKASDSLEHGYGEIDAIIKVAARHVKKLAGRVRSYIVQQLFAGGRRTVLLSDNYNFPLSCLPATITIRGMLTGSRSDLVNPVHPPTVRFTAEATHMLRDRGLDWRVQWRVSDLEQPKAGGVTFTRTADGQNAFEVDGVPMSDLGGVHD